MADRDDEGKGDPEPFDVAAEEAAAAEGIHFADPEEEALFHSTDEPDPEPTRFAGWRRGSGAGAVMTGVALGLQMVFAPPPDLAAVVQEAPGAPPNPDDLYQLHIDHDCPERSTVVFRSSSDGADDPRDRGAGDHQGDHAPGGEGGDAAKNAGR